MSRLHKMLVAMFCLGVFLCGVGVGVAFTELSTLAYGGEHILGETVMRTEEYDVCFEAKKGMQDIIGPVGTYNNEAAKIETDRSVPENTVRFRVTYNADRVEPFAYWDEEEGRIFFEWYWKNTTEEMALMMEAKDVVLENLKKGKLVSFDVYGVEGVTVLVNPKNKGDVQLTY